MKCWGAPQVNDPDPFSTEHRRRRVNQPQAALRAPPGPHSSNPSSTTPNNGQRPSPRNLPACSTPLASLAPALGSSNPMEVTPEDPVSLWISVSEVHNPSAFQQDNPAAWRTASLISCQNLQREWCVSYTAEPCPERGGGGMRQVYPPLPPRGTRRWRVRTRNSFIEDAKDAGWRMEERVLGVIFVGWVERRWCVSTPVAGGGPGRWEDLAPVRVPERANIHGVDGQRWGSREWVAAGLESLVEKGFLGEDEAMTAKEKMWELFGREFKGSKPNVLPKEKKGTTMGCFGGPQKGKGPAGAKRRQ